MHHTIITSGNARNHYSVLVAFFRSSVLSLGTSLSSHCRLCHDNSFSSLALFSDRGRLASLVRSLARYLSSHCLCHDNTFSSEFQVGCPFIHRQCREKVSIVLSPRCTTRLTAVRLYVVVTTRRYLDIVQYWYGTCTIHTGEGQYGTFEKQHTTQRASTQPI